MHPIFSKISPFCGISDDAANYLLLNGVYKLVERGERLYSAGDHVDGYYAVLEGEIHLLHRAQNDIRHVLWPRKKGHWFAYVHHFAGLPAPVSAVAYKKTKLLHVPETLSSSLFRHYPELYKLVLSDVTQEYVEFAEYHKCTVSNSLQGRIARQLVIMALESNRRDIACTQVELATYVGATRKAVGEQLTAMEKQGLIEKKYRIIALSNLTSLNKMVFG